METDNAIGEALKKAGIGDVLEWAGSRPTLSLNELNRLLGTDAAPIELEHYMAAEAKKRGRYDRFVREQLVRQLNYYCPAGLMASTHRPEYVQASAWSFWSSLFEPSHKRFAETAFKRTFETMKQLPTWVPRDADDPLLVKAFEGCSFTPTEAARKREAAVERMWKLAMGNNRGLGNELVLKNLRNAPRGYGMIYGLYTVDGEVCNGGFIQLYGNTAGAPVPFAIEAFRVIGREAIAAVVAESLASVRLSRPALLLPALRKKYLIEQQIRAPRELEILDHEYYNLVEHEETEWLDIAIEALVTEKPEYFDPG
ncbi:MAG: DUF4375 domain-containing protein [Bacteroidota bacterium]